MTVYFNNDFKAFTRKKDSVYCEARVVANESEAIELIPIQEVSEVDILRGKIAKAKILIEKIPHIKILGGEIRRVQLVEYIRERKKEIEGLE